MKRKVEMRRVSIKNINNDLSINKKIYLLFAKFYFF